MSHCSDVAACRCRIRQFQSKAQLFHCCMAKCTFDMQAAFSTHGASATVLEAFRLVDVRACCLRTTFWPLGTLDVLTAFRVLPLVEVRA